MRKFLRHLHGSWLWCPAWNIIWPISYHPRLDSIHHTVAIKILFNFLHAWNGERDDEEQEKFRFVLSINFLWFMKASNFVHKLQAWQLCRSEDNKHKSIFPPSRRRVCCLHFPPLLAQLKGCLYLCRGMIKWTFWRFFSFTQPLTIGWQKVLNLMTPHSINKRNKVKNVLWLSVERSIKTSTLTACFLLFSLCF